MCPIKEAHNKPEDFKDLSFCAQSRNWFYTYDQQRDKHNIVETNFIKHNMRMSKKKILRTVRKKLYHPNEKTTIIVVHNNTITTNRISSANEQYYSEDHSGPHFMSKEDMAAISIQACYRGYLARRMFKALKGLVKLQALVRGVSVRRQAQIALHCMHALARLQVTVRDRQLR